MFICGVFQGLANNNYSMKCEYLLPTAVYVRSKT
uniref:Uncharacterized protein n=1 Tax=Arundo donax TaxID=35708 RepID=A0A0A9CCK6_ARUDO